MFLLRQPFAYGAQGKDARISYFFFREKETSSPALGLTIPSTLMQCPSLASRMGIILLMTKHFFIAGSIRDQSAFP